MKLKTCERRTLRRRAQAVNPDPRPFLSLRTAGYPLGDLPARSSSPPYTNPGTRFRGPSTDHHALPTLYPPASLARQEDTPSTPSAGSVPHPTINQSRKLSNRVIFPLCIRPVFNPAVVPRGSAFVAEWATDASVLLARRADHQPAPVGHQERRVELGPLSCRRRHSLWTEVYIARLRSPVAQNCIGQGFRRE